ncbi:Lipid kinase YegS [Seminavis robusta]|uniref:Lipid kinase YegS n=1 Tax=Seminavis robusta TaxID=568900 RepID=A0A9N8DBS9_9STRA|nr:Lipid kinase YegS [Seminavis robusta]|eukprot:Sro22_g015290.1 Lipid kinase YegS (478) ;mRNA; r:59406-60839
MRDAIVFDNSNHSISAVVVVGLGTFFLGWRLLRPKGRFNPPVSEEPIDLQASRVNVEHHEQLLCYQSGKLNFPKPQGRAPFVECGSFLPFSIEPQHYETNDSVGATPQPKIAMREFLEKHGKPVEVKKAKVKTVAIIYNAFSGAKVNVRDKIVSTLAKHSIEATIFETKHPMHAWDLAEELAGGNYCVIAAAGGDGTLHQVVNGLMSFSKANKMRPPPFAILPNGTGNDFAMNLGVSNLDQALHCLIHGDIVQIDCNLVSVDKETDVDIPKDQIRDRMRYSLASSAAGWVANVNKKAGPLKEYIGQVAYSIMGVTELLFTGSAPSYTLLMEQHNGSQVVVKDLEMLLLFVSNGKYAGGKIAFTPASLLNDGLLDVSYWQGIATLFEALKFIYQAKHGGCDHVYADSYHSYRAKSIVITVEPAGTVSAGQQQSMREHMYQVDGELLGFKRKVQVEVVPKALDVVVDFSKLMRRGPMIR